MKLELIENVLLPALILAAGVVVVQAHAIAYWQATMGAAVGLVASLGAELVGLYLVYQPGRLARATGLALVAVMVLVPAWVICGPEYSAWREAVQRSERAAELRATAPALLAALEQDLAAAERSLREDEAKSAVRAGWLDTLERQREALTALRAKRRALLGARDAPAAAGYDGWGALPKVLPVLALLIAFQLANAGAVLRISGWRHGEIATASPVEIVESEPGFHGAATLGNDGKRAMETVDSFAIATRPSMEIARAIAAPGNGNSSPMETVESAVAMATPHGNLSLDDFTIRRLQEAVREHVRAAGLTGKEFCAREHIQPRDLSLFLRHFEHRKAGARTAPEAVVQRLARRFLSQDRADGQA